MTLTAQQTAEFSEQRKRIRARINEQRERANAARAERDAAEQKGDLNAQISAGARAAKIDEDIEGLRQTEQDVVHLLGQATNDRADTNALSGQLQEVSEVLTRYATSSARMGDLPIAEIPREEVIGWTGRSLAMAAVPAPTPGMLQGPFQRAVPAPTPPTSFLDLVPSAPMEYPSMPYAQEVASAEGSPPAPTAPGSVKPVVDFEYQDAEASPATIAGFLKQTRQTLADVPMLQNLIQTRLMTRTRIALEHEVLSGTGAVSDRTGKPGIVGLLNTTGIGAVSAGVSEAGPDAILDAIVTCLVSGATPNVVAMNPLDWASMLKTKSAGGSEEYVASPFLQTVQSVWSVAMVPAVGVPAKKIVVGDTNLGMTLLVREGANIRVSDADVDDFTRNKVTILCEGRWALAVWVAAAFCVVTLP